MTPAIKIRHQLVHKSANAAIKMGMLVRLGITCPKKVGMPNQLEVTYHKKVGALHPLSEVPRGFVVQVGIQEGVIQEGVIREGATQVVRHRRQMSRLHPIGRLGLLTTLPLMMLVPPSLTDPLRLLRRVIYPRQGERL
jgi:hypothetical protein